MSNAGLTISHPLNRASLTTACAFTTAGILVCGFVAPAMEAREARPDVRVVQLVSRSVAAEHPLGGLFGTLPDADAVTAAFQPPAAETVDVSAAALGGPMIATRLISLLLQPLVWLVQVLPDVLKPIAGGFLIMATVVGAAIGTAIDAVLDPILSLFGFGVLAAAPLTAVEPEVPTSPTVEVAAEESVQPPERTDADSSDKVEIEDLSTQAEAPVQETMPDAVSSSEVTDTVDPEMDSMEVDLTEDEAEAEATQQDSEPTDRDDAAPESGQAAEESTPSPAPSGDSADS